MSKEGKATHIYLQDELGSPVRLVQSGGKRQTLYGYDEFGNDRYGNQGELQPFGYTGYQRDRTAGSYFAQAREYLPEVGRFMGRALAAAFAPVVLAGGAAAGVTVGIMAKMAMLGGTAGSLLDIVYQKMQIDNSERDSFNGYEIAICFLTGAAGAITGPGGASLMAVANYVGVEIVNDNMPGEFETIINGVWGYIGGVMAAEMSSRFESILGRKAYAITNSSGVLTKTYLIEEYGKKYSAKMIAGVFKALLVTNPWYLEKSIDSGNFLIHEIALFTDLIQKRYREFCGAAD